MVIVKPNLSSALEKLRLFVNKTVVLDDTIWKDFSNIWELHISKRKDIITDAGEKENYLYFVLDGIQRVFHTSESGREATLVLSYPPSFAGILDAMMLEQKSKYYFESLTPSVFIKAKYIDVKKLMEKHPSINLFVLKGVSQALSGVLERVVELQVCSSEEKFRILLKRSPHILQLIPHKYIASYLGIDASNFSKLLNNVKI
ncbi:putative transcriptional regulator, Crp/Fnr family [Pseudopedobacter saltans DSM 12145]|uniref:Transcriptional regulator, Crp/Fnr family n=1 Tax=Pseudopedobacter saltans (strain ATCC 51119 / DSM 12145 / JCM 21818 / CCUG 39354 / LMG 10337 / NBRC 100064 / NCIMB 13643) TaxID=762903 RepID=F0SAH3_PSESL|nr:Crp/Fnr family transcriptional regulator [Pseudopedobacter saltans]ADY52593.1 putative transcriptional regulator, Crp/Fnr family [Pseudopedobacter saltans DSM 12145]